MSACSKEQNTEYLIIADIYEKPIRSNMALTLSRMIAFQWMIFIKRRKLVAYGQAADCSLQALYSISSPRLIARL